MPPEVPQARRDLGARLASFRTRAGLTVRDLAARLDLDIAQIARIQSGRRLPTGDLVEDWMEACRVTDPGERRAVADMVDQAHVRSVAWRAAARSGSVQPLERERLDAARLICSYQPAIVPGLLQTPAYARMVLRALNGPGIEVEPTVAGRIANQRALDEPRTFMFVIGERVLERPVLDPDLLAEQRQRITTTVNDHDNVHVWLLPESVIGPGTPFRIYDEPTDEQAPLVTVETLTRDVRFEHPDDVQRYRQAFARLRDAARPLA